MIKVGVAQMRCSLGDVEANCQRIAAFAGQASAAGCQMLVLPEISDIGYQTETIAKCASSWSELPYRTVEQAAKKHALYIVCGLSEKTEHGTFNSVAVLEPSGALLTRYRKTHLFSPPPVAEDRVFTAGDELVTAEIGGITFGFTICYDLRFPELYRSLALRGATVLVNCTAWPAPRIAHWQVLSRARAIENQAYYVGANRLGTDGDITFGGKSLVVSPFGEIVCEADDENEDLLVADLNPEEVQQFRENIPVLKSRRCDVYEL